ncbi:MAG: thioredoxin-like domain-containing protein, partial [Rhodanobacteraceae bacterium]
MFRRTLLTLLASAVLVVALVNAPARAESAVPFPASLPWYNVSRPLTLADLKGRAVLLDFFTPGCINCVHMLPVEQVLELEYGPRLAIIAIDSPDDSAASTRNGVQAFIQRYGLEHPVVLDAKLSLWKAYGVQAWPTLILLGPNGQVRQRFLGEQSLPQLAGPITAALKDAPPASALQPLPRQPMALSKGVLETPAGIAVSPTLVAVADTGHNRIVLANHQGAVQAVIGSGCIGDANGSYQQAA